MNPKLILFALAALTAGFGLTWAEEEAKPAGEGGARPERPAPPARPEGEARPDGKGRPEGPARPEGEARPDGKGKGKGRPPRPEGEGRPGAPDPLKEIDTNADGQITKEEAGERWERLSRLDKNEDGILGKEELAAMSGDRPGGPGTPGGEGRPGGPQMFERADKNGDGKLSKDELPEEAWARLSKADKDGDNAVSREEIGALMREGGLRPGGPEGAGGGGGGRIFEMADTNKDGKLTAEELGERWEQMSQMDKNSDGAITKDEIPQMGAGRGPGSPDGPGGGRPGAAGGGGNASGAIFGQYDKDSDEKLSKAEVPEELWARVSKADKNADGLVSKEELNSLYSSGPGNGPAPGRERPRPEGEATGDAKKARPDQD